MPFMSEAWSNRTVGARLSTLLPLVLLFLGYVLAAKLGLRLALEHPSATPVWPPTGIAIAACVVLGYRAWPVIMAGAFLVNYTTAGNFASSLGIATGNTLEGLVGAYLVQTFANGKYAFDRPHDAARFTLYAAFIATAVSATFGVVSLSLAHFADWGKFGSIWLTWWLGDAAGALIVAPPILAWAAHPVIRWNAPRAVEGGLLLTIVALAGVVIFGRPLDTGGLSYAQGFLCFPAIVWIAFRFYPRVSTASTLILGTIVLVGTLTERGPFSVYEPSAALFIAQAFTGVVAITSLVLSAATFERMVSEQKLRESESRFRTLADSSPSMIWVADPTARCTFLNKTWLSFTGRDVGQDLGYGWLENVHPQDTDELVSSIRTSFAARKSLRADFRLRSANGDYCWVMTTGNPRILSDGTFAGYVGMCLDISDRKKYEEDLQKEALRDPLTSLPNRTLFLDRLGQSLLSSKLHSGWSFGLIFLDIDRFKLINDTLGHVAGDKMLVETAKRLQTVIRPGDTVARLAGDEFAILLENVSDLYFAEEVAERIEGLFREPYRLSGEEFFMSASIGITIVDPRHSRPEDVLQDADTAMYRAKSLGRKRRQVYDSEAHRPVVEVLRLEADLRKAIECGQLDVYYQPIYSMPNEKIVGFEALVRWEHPQRGLLLPNEFIPVAEQTGLIADLDRLVLKKACKQMSEWRSRRLEDRPLSVSVNVSVRLFSQIDVVGAVSEALATSGLDGSCLRLEITESVFMESKEAVARALSALRDIGVGVALDDFGTGYSSLGFLNHFPIDSVKIDRSFIAELGPGGSGNKVAVAIIDLAHSLNLAVTAEGVETEQELAAIRSLKCDFAQGHFFGRPVPVSDAGALLA
jgi:diguanylate cyclase (GGDEF)-like protein/PAS domain S-box-containing protein